MLIWDLPAPVCPYELIRTVTAVIEGGAMRGAGDEHLWLPLDKEIELGQIPCPKSRVWKTSVRHLLVASRSAAAAQSFPPLDAIEVDMGIQTSVQQLYLQRQMILTLEAAAPADRLRCQILWQIMPEQQLLTAGQEGRFVLRLGPIIHEVACHAVTVELDHQTRCYQGIPVKLGSQQMSLDLTTRIVTPGRQESVCNPTFPQMIMDVRGTWWKVGTTAEAVEAPPVWMKTSFDQLHPNEGRMYNKYGLGRDSVESTRY